MAKRHPDIKGWVTLYAGVYWEDDRALWAKHASDGSWFVLRWFNNFAEMGERDCEDGGIEQFECRVLRLVLDDIPPKDQRNAYLSVDLDPIALGENYEYAKIAALIDYGLGAPLQSFYGSVRPLSVRAEARRYAEDCMKDPELLRRGLNRIVNALGSTAEEFGRGDLSAASARLLEQQAAGSFLADVRSRAEPPSSDTAPPASQQEEIMFGTLEPTGELTGIRYIKKADIKRCPFAILLPKHYREDGTCRCDDEDERKRLIKEAGYKKRDFAKIPLRHRSGGSHV